MNEAYKQQIMEAIKDTKDTELLKIVYTVLKNWKGE